MEQYQYAVSKNRNNNMNQIVDHLRYYYTKRRISYNSKTDTTLLSKVLQLKWLPTTYLNPVQECRFMDYIFPLNSAMFEPEYSTNVNLLFGLDKIKRITSIENEFNKGQFKLHMEDRDPNFIQDLSPTRLFNLQYYKKWLLSLNKEKAKFFVDCLDKFQKNLQQVTFEIAEVNANYFNLINSRETNKKEKWTHGKVWIKQLDDRTQNWMQKQKFLARTYETDLMTGVINMVSFDLSYAVLHLMDIYPTLNGEMKGFEFVEKLRSEDWFNFWTG